MGRTRRGMKKGRSWARQADPRGHDRVKEHDDVADPEDIEDIKSVTDIKNLGNVADNDDVEDTGIAEDTEAAKDTEDTEAAKDTEAAEDIEAAEDTEDFRDLDDIQDIDELDDIRGLKNVQYIKGFGVIQKSDLKPGILDSAREIEFRDEVFRSALMLPPRYEQERVSKEFSHIRRPLVANAFGRRVVQVEDGNLIAVASAISGEGKTFVSIQLALSIARERDVAVVLVDGDLPKADLTRLFGANEKPGLADMVSDPSISLSDVLLKTSKPGIWFVPAGTNRQDGADNLSGELVDKVIESFTGLGENVITVVDTSPLTLVSEARLITSYAGQVLLVVKANSTPRRKVLDAIELIDTNPESPILLLLNQADRPSFAGYGVYANSDGDDE